MVELLYFSHTWYIYIYAGLSYDDTEAGVMYTLNASSGKLTQIASLVDNTSIAVEHRDQEYPVLFTHSNGKSLNVTYTDSGLISYVDLYLMRRIMLRKQGWLHIFVHEIHVVTLCS